MREGKGQLAGTRRGVRPVLDQQGEHDRKQDGEKKPSFHGDNSGTRIRRVNSGSRATGSIVPKIASAKTRRSGRCQWSGFDIRYPVAVYLRIANVKSKNSTSAANLKLLSTLRRVRHRNFKFKAATQIN